MFESYGQLLQSFVQLKYQVQKTPESMQAYQLRMNLFTLLTSFRADILEHLKRTQDSLNKQKLVAPQQQQQAPNSNNL